MSRLPSGVSSTASPGLTWASWRGSGRSVRKAKPVLPVSSTKIADRGLAALLGRDGLLAGGDEQHLEPVDVALGDAVGRVEGEGGLVVLARRAQLAELPERLGEAVLGLGVGAELEELAVRRRGVGPLGGGGLGDGLLGQLALEAGQVDRALGGRLDIGEGHEGVVLSGRGGGRRGSGRRTRAGRWTRVRCAGIAF